jgi:hypothetical protein
MHCYQLLTRQFLLGALGLIISVDSDSRGKFTEEIQHIQFADVTGVQDEVDTSPYISQAYRQVKKAILVMCVGYKTNRDYDLSLILLDQSTCGSTRSRYPRIRTRFSSTIHRCRSSGS